MTRTRVIATAGFVDLHEGLHRRRERRSDEKDADHPRLLAIAGINRPVTPYPAAEICRDLGTHT